MKIDPDDYCKGLDFAAIGRICDAVRSPRMKIPEDLTISAEDDCIGSRLTATRKRRNALIRAINGARADAVLRTNESDDKVAIAAMDTLSAIARQAKGLAELLLVQQGRISETLRERGLYAPKLATQLDGLAEAATAEMADRKRIGTDTKGLLTSIGDDSSIGNFRSNWIAGMAEVFSVHFGKPAGVSTTKAGEIIGPFVRFINAVETELGVPVPITGENIKKIIDKSRKAAGEKSGSNS